MPPSPEPRQKPLKPPVLDAGPFPPHAYEFIHEGLDYTVAQIHGKDSAQSSSPRQTRHVSGQQLCEGLRELALAKWGRMARTVLRRWNITCTLDFGRMVFAMIDTGQMQKVEEDTIDDFKSVFEFKAAFETDYRIPSHS